MQGSWRWRKHRVPRSKGKRARVWEDEEGLDSSNGHKWWNKKENLFFLFWFWHDFGFGNGYVQEKYLILKVNVTFHSVFFKGPFWPGSWLSFIDFVWLRSIFLCEVFIYLQVFFSFLFFRGWGLNPSFFFLIIVLVRVIIPVMKYHDHEPCMVTVCWF